MSNKVLVTGSAGFIGSKLVERLQGIGLDVEGFDVAQGLDLRDAAQVERAIADKDAVFHLAAVADLNWARVHPRETMEINIEGTWNIAKACSDNRVPLYFASTCCFRAGTMIQTKEGSKPIEQIRAGDTVVSHTGDLRRVLRIGKRPYQGRLQKIYSIGNLPVQATPEHPFLVRTSTGFTWKQAKDLCKGDRLVSPSQKAFYADANTPTGKAYLLGLFVAEGSLAHDANHRSITYHFGEEPQLMAAVGSGMKEHYGKDPHDQSCAYLNQKGNRRTFYGQDLIPEFEICYTSSEHRAFTKSVPADIYQSPDADAKSAFLRGFIDGDGGLYHTRKSGNVVMFATVSEALAWQLRQTLINMGVFPALSTRKPATHIQGRAVNAHKTFVFQVRGADAKKLFSLFGQEGHQYTTKPRQKYAWEDGDVVTPIHRIGQEYFSGDVYNFEVEKDNSYIANGVAVHNCVYGNQKIHPVTEETLPNPAEIYACSKLAGENVIKGFHFTYGLEYVMMRFATIYGEGTRPALGTHIFLRQALKGEPITVHGDGKQTRTLTYITDLVDAIMAAYQSKRLNQIWNMTTTEEVSALQMAQNIKELTGSGSKIVFIPQRVGQTFRESVSADKIKNDTGWEARVKWQDGIRAMYDWFSKTGQEENLYKLPQPGDEDALCKIAQK